MVYAVLGLSSEWWEAIGAIAGVAALVLAIWSGLRHRESKLSGTSSIEAHFGPIDQAPYRESSTDLSSRDEALELTSADAPLTRQQEAALDKVYGQPAPRAPSSEETDARDYPEEPVFSGDIDDGELTAADGPLTSEQKESLNKVYGRDPQRRSTPTVSGR
jgi:hypothetical protein